jgi:hypothetical protein
VLGRELFLTALLTTTPIPPKNGPSKGKKPRIATTYKRTTAKSKRKHDDSEDDSDDDDPPSSKKRKCGRRSPEKSSYLCSDCGSGDGQPATGSTPIDDHHDAETTTPNSSPNNESFRGDISDLFEDDDEYVQFFLNLEFNTEQYKETSESEDLFIPVVCKGLEKYFAVNDEEYARTLAISDLGVSVYYR